MSESSSLRYVGVCIATLLAGLMLFAVAVAPAQAVKKGTYKVCKSAIVDAPSPGSSFLGWLLKGSHIKIRKTNSSGNWAYGYAYGDIRQSAWIKVSALCSKRNKELKPTSTAVLKPPSLLPITINDGPKEGEALVGTQQLVKTSFKLRKRQEATVTLSCPKGLTQDGMNVTPLPTVSTGVAVIVRGKYGKRNINVELIAFRSKTSVTIYTLCD